MITDRLANGPLYHAVHPNFARAFAYLRSFDPDTADGVYPLGDGSEARVQRYHTRPVEEREWESHRRYIDIQYLVSGEESMLHADIGALHGATAYDDANDVILYADAMGPASSLGVLAGGFVIFYPHDGHRPGIALRAPAPVVKVVVKVPVMRG
jgi:YhcH/YjgK/YiaL family protein